MQNKLVDKLLEECTETVKEVKIAKIALAEEGENKHKCSSCKLFVVLFSVIFTVNVLNWYLFCFSHWFKKNNAIVDLKEITIY